MNYILNLHFIKKKIFSFSHIAGEKHIKKIRVYLTLEVGYRLILEQYHKILWWASVCQCHFSALLCSPLQRRVCMSQMYCFKTRAACVLYFSGEKNHTSVCLLFLVTM